MREGGRFDPVGSASRRQSVWCSQRVSWRSRFRACVIGAQVVALDCNAGDPALRPCERTIAAAVRAYDDIESAPAG